VEIKDFLIGDWCELLVHVLNTSLNVKRVSIDGFAAEIA
jgi:hypothetical protein